MHAADILAGGARLIRTQPKAVAIWGIVYLIAVGAMMALIWPMFGELFAFQQQALAAQAAQLPPPPPPAGFFGAIFGLDAVFLVVLVAIFAAAVRAVAQGGDDGLGFLRFGMDELRLIGLTLILFVIGFVSIFVLGLVFGIAIAAVAGMGGGSTGSSIALSVIAVLAFMAAAVWVEVRISLAGALTVLRGRIVIREAWRATRGRFWTLFGVYFLIGFVYMVVSITLMSLVTPNLFGAYAGGMQPGDMQAVLAQQQAMFANPFAPGVIALWLVGAIVMAVGMAFTFGAVATAAIGYSEADHTAAV